jgi:hypothetical protein
MVKDRALPGFFVPHACHRFRCAGRRINLQAASKAPPTIIVFTGVDRSW